jgi:hypothetical protein
MDARVSIRDEEEYVVAYCRFEIFALRSGKNRGKPLSS